MEEIDEPWFMDDWGTTVQPKIVRKWIGNEDNSRLDWPRNNGSCTFVVSFATFAY